MTEYYEALLQEEQEKIRDIIRKLYRQTFLLERRFDKKEGRLVLNRDYYDCGRHMDFLKWYFEVAGIGLYENTQLGTIYIQGEDTMGEKLPMLATIYLLLLKLIYEEQMAAVSTSINIVTTLGELSGKAGEFRLVRSLSSQTEIRRALAMLKRYQMIEVLDSMEELNDQTRILIFPSINVVLMREDILKLLESFQEETQVSGDIADMRQGEPEHETSRMEKQEEGTLSLDLPEYEGLERESGKEDLPEYKGLKQESGKEDLPEYEGLERESGKEGLPEYKDLDMESRRRVMQGGTQDGEQ